MHERALLNYAAHFVESDYVSPSSGEASIGAVRKRTIGKVSVEYATVSSSDSDDFFNSTRYGRRYKFLVNQMCGPVSF